MLLILRVHCDRDNWLDDFQLIGNNEGSRQHLVMPQGRSNEGSKPRMFAPHEVQLDLSKLTTVRLRVGLMLNIFQLVRGIYRPKRDHLVAQATTLNPHHAT